MSTRVVNLSGEFDATVVATRRAELIEECDRSLGSLLLLDFTEVTFIDSTGLGLLIGVARRMRDGGGQVRLRGCRRGVRRVLSVSGVDAILTIEESSEATPSPLPLAGGQR